MLNVSGYCILSLDSAEREKTTALICRVLAGGEIGGQEARLFPGNRRVRIKEIVPGDSAVRLRVKGAARALLTPGAMLVDADWPVDECREALLLSDGRPLPRRAHAVFGGISPEYNRENLKQKAAFFSDGPFFRVQFPRPHPLMPGMEIVTDDSRRFTVLWPGRPDADERRRLMNQMRRRPHPSLADIYRIILHVRGFVALPPPLRACSWEEAGLLGSWLVNEKSILRLKKRIRKLSFQPGGVNGDGLRMESLPTPLLHALTRTMIDHGEVIERDGWLLPPDRAPLSPFHRSWLRRVQEAGTEGIRVRSVAASADKLALGALGRSGLIRGGKEVWLSNEAVEQMAASLLSQRHPGEKLTMADARDRLGGSRPVTVELLNLLSDDGLLELEEARMERVIK